MANAAAPEAEIAALQKENVELEQKVQALKKQLGITDGEEKAEQARIKSLFDLFDTDKSGFLDMKEFQVLATEVGLFEAVKSPASLAAAFAKLNPQEGKVTFDAFYKWYRAADAAPADAKDNKDAKVDMKTQVQDSILKLRLKSQALTKRIKIQDKKGAEQKEEAPKLATSAFSIQIGNIPNPRAQIAIKTLTDAVEAKARRDALGTDDVKAKILAQVDLELKADFDESQVGELCGALEALLSAVPWQAVPVPVYSSHNVDVVDVGGKKFLRVSVASPFDPTTVVPTMNSSYFGQGQGEINLPLSIDDILDPNFRMDASKLKIAFTGKGEVNLNALRCDNDQAALARFPLAVQVQQRVQDAFAKSVRNFNFDVKVQDLKEFVDSVPNDLRGSAMMTFVQFLEGILPNIPVGEVVRQGFQSLPALAIYSGQQALYDAVQKNVVGLSAVSVLYNNFRYAINLKGLDFGKYLVSSQ